MANKPFQSTDVEWQTHFWGALAEFSIEHTLACTACLSGLLGFQIAVEFLQSYKPRNSELLEIAAKNVKHNIIQTIQDNGFHTPRMDEARRFEQLTQCVRSATKLEIR